VRFAPRGDSICETDSGRVPRGLVRPRLGRNLGEHREYTTTLLPARVLVPTREFRIGRVHGRFARVSLEPDFPLNSVSEPRQNRASGRLKADERDLHRNNGHVTVRIWHAARFLA
jgi:hypothetical protein